jgi:transposase
MEQRTFSPISLMHRDNIQYPIVVSLDVHDQNTYVFTCDITTGHLMTDCNIAGPFSKAIKKINSLKLSKDRCLIIYEAGSLGFFPYRVLTAAGYTVRVIAPSSIPNKGKQQKTDRDDAKDNLSYHISGLLHYVTPPSEEDESARDILRYRHTAACAVSRQKQKILSMAKRYGLFYTETKTNWTKKHRAWLIKVECIGAARVLLNFQLDELECAEHRLSRVEEQLDTIFAGNELYQTRFALYRKLPGFGRVNSMIMTLEGGSLDRFGRPDSLMNYAGLVPLKHSSGQSDPALRITKAGNFYIRLGLVGAAKAYGNEKQMAAALKRAQQMEGPMKDFVLKTIDRLSSRFRALCAKRKNRNKVKCAIARELCGNVWELMVKVAPQLDEYRLAA